MAQETQKSAVTTEPVPAPATTPAPAPMTEVPAEKPVAEKEVAVPAPEKVVAEKEAPAPEPEPEPAAEKAAPAAVAEEKTTTVEAEKVIVQSVSFKEESNVASELPEAQRKALEELKELVREALNKHEFTAPPPAAPAKEEEKKKEEKAEEKKAEEETKDKEIKEETKEDKKEEEKKEDKKEEDKKEVKEEKSEEKKDETPAAPAPAVTETKREETPAAPATTDTKKDEKPTAPAPATAPAVAETKPEEKPAAPATAETKKEEKPTAPAAAAAAAPEVAAPIGGESKKEETVAAPAPVEAKSAAPATTETKTQEKPAAPAPAASETITIEKAFAADEDGAKTVEAIEETIVPVSTPETAAPTAAEEPKEAEAPPVDPEEVSIWGIPLLQDERSDVILLKFLRARDFKVKEAFAMLKNTVRWRKDFKIDEILEEDLGNEFEKMVFMHGVDKQGHTVVYSSYSEFQNKELFSDKEKRNTFLKWRIQFQEKCVRALDFSPAAKSSFLFISDFKNAPGLGKRALWQFIKQAVKLFEDNYPEFVAKELFINVPWWYIPYYRTIGSFTTPRTKSKMVLAGPSKSADAIFRYVAPEQVPVKYGGLGKESHLEQLFAPEDTVTDVIVKPAATHTIELPASEACILAWELRVLGSDVNYGAQFEPSTEGSYTVIVSKNRKIGLIDEPVINDSFKVGEPGKVVITIDNQTSKKKKLLYRFKTQPRSD